MVQFSRTCSIRLITWRQLRDKDVQLWFWRQVILFGFYLLFEPDDSAFNQVQPCWTLVKFDNILLNLPKLKRMSNICSSPSYTRVDFSKKKISQNLTHILGIQGTSEMKNFFIVFLYFKVFKLKKYQQRSLAFLFHYNINTNYQQIYFIC